jgi:putative membrane protein
MGMEYFFEGGFLATRAPFYMDGIVVYLLLLPLLVGFSISLAVKRKYELHRFLQTLLFVVSFFSLLLFHYGIHVSENFDELIAISSVSDKQAFYFLIGQTILSIVTLVMWLSTLLFAGEDRRRRGLPGLYSHSHKSSGRKVFMAILLTTFSSAYLYWMLFIA